MERRELFNRAGRAAALAAVTGSAAYLLYNRRPFACVPMAVSRPKFDKKQPQDLLVLDMIMPPGIDGAETYQRVLETNPRQKAIILSGYAETDRVFAAQQMGAGAFVKKPVTMRVIAAAVRAELDRKEKLLVT